MRNLTLLPLFLLVISCHNRTDTLTNKKTEENPAKTSITDKTNEKPVKTERYTLEPATKAAFDQAATRQPVSFKMGPEEARKENGVLVLKINQKWTPLEAFRDTLLNTDDPEIREYRYLGQNQALHQYLVAGSFYEGFETYLVDKTTGKITPTWAEPSVSPDHKYLANVSRATVMEGEPNGVQVWKVAGPNNSSAIAQHLEIEPQDWEPFELQWESPESIIIKMMPTEKYEQLQAEPKEEDFSYLRLRVK
ncbi:hypothetical protein AHMF7605_18475 [Adhaeribacter arboris]|uniref:Lipoprotein n=1 Tax=Adhaeribacter arboris TaxID=2072846 RepID=A0A2T2YIL8_9BACT|nr:hypothetical protein [Adhaeribacter arboris]PSR55350.1 hypothetical protein AHMF7605_18475 [Adhaeribacter arboris]